MHVRAVNNWIRMPLLLMAGVEVAILYSSLYFAGVVLYGGLGESEQIFGSMGPKAALVASIGIVCLVAMGLYHFNQRLWYREAALRILIGLGAGYLAAGVLFYLLKEVTVDRELAGVAFAYSLVLTLGVRYFFVRTVDENVFRRRTLIYGAGERAASLLDLRRRADRRGFKVVGRVAAPGDTIIGDRSNVLLTNEKTICELAVEAKANEIVIAMDERRGNLPIRDLLDARLQGIDVIDLLEFFERETGKIRVDLVNPGWLIFSPGFRIARLRQYTARTLDLLISVPLLAITWPLMLMIALCIKMEEGIGASVFYRQCRVGKGGRHFDVLKFRSMTVDAEADGKARWAEKNDSRVTNVGAMLRKARLDELPQVLNVLKGEMSIVGPRPERPEFVAALQKSVPYYAERHAVKPGVTGWAQLRYSYGASEEDALEKLHYDLYYIKNQRLMLDIIIILQTVEVVLWGKGAR